MYEICATRTIVIRAYQNNYPIAGRLKIVPKVIRYANERNEISSLVLFDPPKTPRMLATSSGSPIISSESEDAHGAGNIIGGKYYDMRILLYRADQNTYRRLWRYKACTDMRDNAEVTESSAIIMKPHPSSP